MYIFFGRKSLLFFCNLLIFLTASAQSYNVSGGDDSPVLAVDDQNNRLQVYVVNGVNQTSISYTSSSSNHSWFRYKNKALEAEAIVATQNGTTSTITNVEDGYGYFVKEENIMNQSYVWITDYAQHPVEINQIKVAENIDACTSFRLDGDITMDQLTYYLPSNGIPTELKRTFLATYNSLEWNDERKNFDEVEVEQVIEGNPFLSTLPAPLSDTRITLSGDQFASHFGQASVSAIEAYNAVAIKAYADTTCIIDFSEYIMQEGEGFSAPVTISFKAYGNKPVAALFLWKITVTTDEQERELVRYTGEEVEYTFTEFGEYTVALEVTDRSGACTDVSNIYTFNVVESGLSVPNTFTPGTSPGINDVFQVKYKSLISFKGTIFNRWGNVLYNWTNPASGWDGMQNGKYVAPGVYFYVIEATGSDGVEYLEKGDINVIRPKQINDVITE